MEGLEVKIKLLAENFPNLVNSFNEFGYRRGPALYFYKKVVSLRKNYRLDELLRRKESLDGFSFIEIVYAALACWDMNTRGAKMKNFTEFKETILDGKELFLELSKYRLGEFGMNELEEVKKKLGNLYDKLNPMDSGLKLKANSKIMHFILPDLVIPMDGRTLEFFYGNNGESKNKFLSIFECTHKFAQRMNLRKYIDDEWNLTVPKVIDNAIIGERMKG